MNAESLILSTGTQWMFKQADQELYADELGYTYVYDNRHSTRVAPRDLFVYLDKRGGGYALTGHGAIMEIRSRDPGPSESHTPGVRRIYTAYLGDYINYSKPIDLRPRSAEGRQNRFLLGIIDVNRLGWSPSIARLQPLMFMEIVNLAYQMNDFSVRQQNPPTLRLQPHGRSSRLGIAWNGSGRPC